MAVSLLALAAATFAGWLDPSWVYDNYLPLLTASILFSFALSTFLYARSFAPAALLALGGNTGSPLYDFFIGRELNPRVGRALGLRLDLKEWCELYPGLIGWAGLNLAYAYKQYTLVGGVSTPMLLVSSARGWGGVSTPILLISARGWGASPRPCCW